jgi:hypothetical protein
MVGGGGFKCDLRLCWISLCDSYGSKPAPLDGIGSLLERTRDDAIFEKGLSAEKIFLKKAEIMS